MQNSARDLIKRAARDLASSQHAIALTGAGISTESGIPDFRGPSGVWTKDPEAERRAYRSYHRFLEDPAGWWEERLSNPFGMLGDLAKAVPNAGHRALADLENTGILKSVLTQNVDGLHEKAGSRNVLEYHGNLFKLRCVSCHARFSRDEYDLEKLLAERKLPPQCRRCGGLVKTDGVAFGEPIPQDVARRSLEEARRCDLMLICGTSAVVYPFAELPRVARERKVAGSAAVTIVEVNAEPTPLTHERVTDYLIQGKTGEVLPDIVEEVRRLRES